jgi:hypothetical protein
MKNKILDLLDKRNRKKWIVTFKYDWYEFINLDESIRKLKRLMAEHENIY